MSTDQRMVELKATIEKLWVQFCESPMCPSGL